MILRLAPHLVGDLKAIEPVPFGNPFEPASRGWITKERSVPGHIGDPRAGQRREGRDPLPPLFRRRRRVPRAGDRLGWTVLGWLTWNTRPRAAGTLDRERQTPLRTWGICGLMLLATMLNYMDRQTLAQQATEIRGELEAQQRGLRPARDGLRPGVRRRRHRHGVHRRPGQPPLALPGDPPGLVGRRFRDRLGHELSRALRSAGSCSASSRPASGPAPWRPRSGCSPAGNRPLGNSILQSGASLGAIATPDRHSAAQQRRARGLAAAVPGRSVRRAWSGSSPGWWRSARATWRSPPDASPEPTPDPAPDHAGDSRPGRHERGEPADPSSAGSWSWWWS